MKGIELPHRFVTKSHWQLNDCLFPNCPNNKSELEIRCAGTCIRCCTNKDCINYAKSVAFGFIPNPTM